MFNSQVPHTKLASAVRNFNVISLSEILNYLKDSARFCAAQRVVVVVVVVLTMVDGKICSTLSQYDSSQKCFICGASPKQMNYITTDTTSTSNQEMYTFGISPLHSWIRAFECLLHISYKLEIKKWQTL